MTSRPVTSRPLTSRPAASARRAGLGPEPPRPGPPAWSERPGPGPRRPASLLPRSSGQGGARAAGRGHVPPAAAPRACGDGPARRVRAEKAKERAQACPGRVGAEGSAEWVGSGVLARCAANRAEKTEHAGAQRGSALGLPCCADSDCRVSESLTPLRAPSDVTGCERARSAQRVPQPCTGDCPSESATSTPRVLPVGGPLRRPRPVRGPVRVAPTCGLPRRGPGPVSTPACTRAGEGPGPGVCRPGPPTWGRAAALTGPGPLAGPSRPGPANSWRTGPRG